MNKKKKKSKNTKYSKISNISKKNQMDSSIYENDASSRSIYADDMSGGCSDGGTSIRKIKNYVSFSENLEDSTFSPFRKANIKSAFL